MQTAQSVALNTAVLLEGPSGSGQHKAASTAAAALGVHLAIFSCEELRGPSDLKTAAALKATFETAADFAPAILLLQDLPALIDSHHISGIETMQHGHSALSEILNSQLMHFLVDNALAHVVFTLSGILTWQKGSMGTKCKLAGAA